mmetsp:Transcript_12869/g.19545  ORF Transcript_12869/g.19545 Transcript_12869/m.19545 type:complete len:455 (-) Transcript_12869:627-1991(-)|eukprot:CAMPEP_0196816942 /NCGR_PEP_ID=MMETSP1362-20130617/57772_1 /TAXON_ID=163516 /ORGANISM="Leptocylindrus danicus, Strain CCMP1856" /LENGTH=454 /DNA_ID=CAMNT_0042194437 /DNA_START=74 /DNA_END=1438 /DNA_ORIENTATION=+
MSWYPHEAVATNDDKPTLFWLLDLARLRGRALDLEEMYSRLLQFPDEARVLVPHESDGIPRYFLHHLFIEQFSDDFIFVSDFDDEFDEEIDDEENIGSNLCAAAVNLVLKLIDICPEALDHVTPDLVMPDRDWIPLFAFCNEYYAPEIILRILDESPSSAFRVDPNTMGPPLHSILNSDSRPYLCFQYITLDVVTEFLEINPKVALELDWYGESIWDNVIFTLGLRSPKYEAHKEKMEHLVELFRVILYARFIGRGGDSNDYMELHELLLELPRDLRSSLLKDVSRKMKTNYLLHMRKGLEILLYQFMRKFKWQISKRNSRGYFPLPLLLLCKHKALILQFIKPMIGECMEAAAFSVNDWNICCLHISLENHLLWHEGVKELCYASGKIVNIRNPETRLYPFMEAAVGFLADLDTVFSLLHASPRAARGLAKKPTLDVSFEIRNKLMTPHQTLS